MPSLRSHSPPLSVSLSFFFLTCRRPPRPTLFPYTTLFRSAGAVATAIALPIVGLLPLVGVGTAILFGVSVFAGVASGRSEEHTSELQSLRHLVCRLLLEKKKGETNRPTRACSIRTQTYQYA